MSANENSSGSREPVTVSESHERGTIRRELLFKARKQCEDMLLIMSATLPVSGDTRSLILHAAIHKSINQSRLIERLSTDNSTLESCAVIGRSLIETIVNGCYLQIASDEEVRAYQLFDVLPTSKLLRVVETKAPGELAKHVPAHYLERFEKHVSNVSQETGLVEKDFGWTRLKVLPRCQKIDTYLGIGEAFAYLGQSIFPLAHAFVHGNYKSLERYLPNARSEAEYYDDMNLCLYGTALTLFALNAFVAKVKGIDIQPRLQEIGMMLEQYTASLLPDLPERWESFSIQMDGVARKGT